MLGCISSDLAVQVSQVFAPGALFLPHLSHYLLKLLVKRGNGVINVLLFIFCQFAILLPGHGLTVLGLGCECQPCRSPDHGEVLFIRLPSKRVQLLLLLVTHLLGDVPAFLLILLALKSLGYLRLQVFYEFPHVVLEVIPATSREADSLGAMGEVEVGHVYPVRGRRLLCSLSNKKLADGAGFPGARGTKGTEKVSNISQFFVTQDGEKPRPQKGEYEKKRRDIAQQVSDQQEEKLNSLRGKADEQNFTMVRTPAGLAFAPKTEDGETMPREQYSELSEDEQKNIDDTISSLNEELQQVMTKVRQEERAGRENLRDLDGEVTTYAAKHLVDELKAKWDSP